MRPEASGNPRNELVDCPYPSARLAQSAYGEKWPASVPGRMATRDGQDWRRDSDDATRGVDGERMRIKIELTFRGEEGVGCTEMNQDKGGVERERGGRGQPRQSDRCANLSSEEMGGREG